MPWSDWNRWQRLRQANARPENRPAPPIPVSAVLPPGYTPGGPPQGGYAPGQDPNPHHPSNRPGYNPPPSRPLPANASVVRYGVHNPSNVTSGYTGANLMNGTPNPQAAQPSQPAAPTQPMPFEAQVLNTIMPSATVQPKFSDPYEQWKQSGRQGPRPY